MKKEKVIKGYVLYNTRTGRLGDFWSDLKGAKIGYRYWYNKGRKHYSIGECRIKLLNKKNK